MKMLQESTVYEYLNRFHTSGRTYDLPKCITLKSFNLPEISEIIVNLVILPDNNGGKTNMKSL